MEVHPTCSCRQQAARVKRAAPGAFYGQSERRTSLKAGPHAGTLHTTKLHSYGAVA